MDAKHHNDRLDRVQRVFAEHADWLQQQGSLVSKRIGSNTYWYLRFFVVTDTRRVHKSVFICGTTETELLAEARRLLGELRARQQRIREAEELAHLVAQTAGVLRQARLRRGRHRARA